MIKSLMTLSALVFFVFQLFSNNAIAGTASRCIQKRGTLEMGSGSTKIFAAKVDFCAKKIIEVLVEKKTAMPFNEHLERSKDKVLESAAYDEGVLKITPLVKELELLKLDHVDGIATSAFRVAKNGREIIKKYSREFRIPIKIISQKEEAILGYKAARLRSESAENQDVIVWDIGGGSMQIVHESKAGKVQIYEGATASVSYKNELIKVVKGLDLATVSTPNPISPFEDAAIAHSKKIAEIEAPKWLKKISEKAVWIGIGGVLSGSVQQQSKSGARSFTVDELRSAFMTGAKLSDEEIKSDYRTTDISNLGLVLGFMESLKISRIQTISTALGVSQVLFPNRGAVTR